jgi:hypothetical protein
MSVDLYGTHQEYLKAVVDFKGKFSNSVEFGMGDFSTSFLIENSDKCTSIEMQSSEWYTKMVDKFGKNEKWTPYSMMGPMEFLKIQYDQPIDFAFVDGHGDSRPECINFMMEKKCPIIMSHDTEAETYGWKRVLKNDYKKLDFTKHENWTSLWTLDKELYDYMCDFY